MLCLKASYFIYIHSCRYICDNKIKHSGSKKFYRVGTFCKSRKHLLAALCIFADTLMNLFPDRKHNLAFVMLPYPPYVNAVV